MVNVRPQPDAFGSPWAPRPGGAPNAMSGSARGRFHVLLTQDRDHAPEHWTQQLPRLLEPQGVVAFVARCGQEAIEFVQTRPIHAAVIDLATPRRLSPDSAPTPQPGVWLLELLLRLQNRPPVVLLRSPAGDPRQGQRELLDALKRGAFTVLDKPVEVEQLLAVFKRLVEKAYQDRWPQ